MESGEWRNRACQTNIQPSVRHVVVNVECAGIHMMMMTIHGDGSVPARGYKLSARQTNVGTIDLFQECSCQSSRGGESGHALCTDRGS